MGLPGTGAPAPRAIELVGLAGSGKSTLYRALAAASPAVVPGVPFGGLGHLRLGLRHAVRLMLPRNSNDKIIARVVYTGPVPAPVKKGQAIGRLKVWRNDAVALDMPLEAGADVGVGTLSQRAFDAATEMVITLFRAGADRL